MKTLAKTFVISTALLPLWAAAQINVENARIVATQQANEPSAIYMKLHNSSNETVNLAMVQSAQQPEATFHLHGTQNGKMIMVEGIEVPAQGSVELKRGGLHIMVFDVNKPLSKGDSLPVTLFFDNGEKIEQQVEVVTP